MSRSNLNQSDVEKRLKYIYRIDNHPVSHLPQPIITQYLEGLGAVLYDVANGDDYMRLLFEQWAFSISGDNHSLSFKSDKKAIKKAISLFRIKWKLFRLKYEFFFDCYYLTEKYDSGQRGRLPNYLQDSVGLFTKKSLSNVNQFFLDQVYCAKIPATLTNHRDDNKNWVVNIHKRLLVVANMSAGKSTLINALVGYRLNRTRTTVCTNRICKLYNNRNNRDGVYIYNSGTRWRD